MSEQLVIYTASRAKERCRVSVQDRQVLWSKIYSVTIGPSVHHVVQCVSGLFHRPRVCIVSVRKYLSIRKI